MASSERAKQELDRIVKLFESGNVGEAIAHVAIPGEDVPSGKWSWGNRLLHI